MATLPTHAPSLHLDRFVAARTAASDRFFADEAGRIAHLCHLMAERFARGGRLLAVGGSPQARSDARHVAVEFVHPGIVGKRALPALALVPDGGPLPDQIDLVARAEDMAIGFGLEDSDGAVHTALASARERGLLTISFWSGAAEWEFVAPAPTRSFARSSPRRSTTCSGSSCTSSSTSSRARLRGRVPRRSSTRFWSRGRRATSVPWSRTSVDRCCSRRPRSLSCGSRRSKGIARTSSAPQGWPERRALALLDPAIISALANDIGPDVLFGRQIIAYGRRGDVAVALSTSGDSVNIIEALAEARRRGLATVAFVGYGGGRIARDRLADHVVVTPSQHIPRIQEAQATAYHAFRELVEYVDSAKEEDT